MSYQDQQLTGCVTQGKSLNPSGFLFPDVSLTYWTRCSCSHVTWVSGDKEPVNMCLQKRFWRRDGPGLALLPHFIPACWALFCSWLVVYSRETGFPFLCRVCFFFFPWQNMGISCSHQLHVVSKCFKCGWSYWRNKAQSRFWRLSIKMKNVKQLISIFNIDYMLKW